MERSTNSLTYKGSIADAINQSRKQKKLFVVYISGENETSSNLEQSTWVDENVAQVMQRCCIFLHLIHGNVDASQFLAIYPQKSFPSISVIGLNGVMLWNHEGYISAEDLKGSIEKAWAALHLQETAAALLTASLATKKAGSVHTSSIAPPPQASSSTSGCPSASSDQTAESSGVGQSTDSTNLVEQPLIRPSDDKHMVNIRQECSGSNDVEGVRTIEDKKPDSAITKDKNALPDLKNSNMDTSVNLSVRDSVSIAERKSTLDDGCTMDHVESDPSTTTDREVPSQLVETEKRTNATTRVLTSDSVKSNDIELSIRMPNGPSLQIKLTKEDIFRSVKHFVDENQHGESDSYDLAIPYPRKLFTEQDMGMTLSELGFVSRQALIVVPRRQPAGAPRHQSSSSYDLNHNMSTENSGGAGYFGYFRTVLSYMNPFSYFGGNPTSNSEQLANEGLQQYGPTPDLHHRAAMGTASQRQYLSDNWNQAPGANSGNTGGRQSRSFGGNVHTLRDADQGTPGDRNLFWNGNSTEFGGNDRK